MEEEEEVHLEEGETNVNAEEDVEKYIAEHGGKFVQFIFVKKRILIEQC